MIRPPPSSPLFPSTTLSRPPPPVRHVRAHRAPPGLRVAPQSVFPARLGCHGRGRACAHLLRLPQGTPAGSSTRTHLRSEEHTSELQSQSNLVCRLLLETIK